MQVIEKMRTNQSQIMVADNHPWMEHKTLQKEINHGMYTQAFSSNLVKELLHALVCQFNAEESGGIGRHCTSKSWTESREEGLETAASVNRADNATYGRLARCTLQARLDSVNGEDRNPHGDTGSTTSTHNGG